MAALQRIRQHSVALLVIVGLAMVAFIVGDLINSSSSILQSSRDKVVTINGKKITREEYETVRQRKQDFYKAMYGQELNAQATQQINQEVYTQFVSSTLLNETCEKLGISVTKDEINELVQGSTPSPLLTQMFGQQAPQVIAQFVNLITNDGFEEMAQSNSFFTQANWEEIENQVVLFRLQQKYTNLVAAAVAPNKLEAKDNFDGDNKECSFAYVKQYGYSVPDSLAVPTSDDVKKYYESNRRNFKINPERVDVNYISVAIRPSEQDYAEAEADIKSLRDDFANTADVAELVNGNSTTSYLDAWQPLSAFDSEIRQFVESNETGAILEPHREGTDAYMMARIMGKTVASDSIEIAVVNVPTATEADSIAKVLNSTDAATALASYTDQQKFVGWMQDPLLLQSFGDELRNKIRSASVNEIIKHEINANATIVCKVTKKTAPVALAKVAIYSTEVFPSTRTRNEEFGNLNRFLTTYKTVKAMQDSARAEGYMMVPATLQTTDYSVGTVQDAREAVRFAFENGVGEVSKIFETGDNFLVVAVTGEVQSGYRSLKDTTFYKQLSQFNVLPLKKIEKLEADMNAVADKTLAGYAAAYETSIDTAKFVNFNLQRIDGLGVEPKIVEAALKATEGEVITVAGRSVVVALQVLSKNNDKGLTYDEEARTQNVARSSEYAQVARAAMFALENAAEIEDNRITFY